MTRYVEYNTRDGGYIPSRVLDKGQTDITGYALDENITPTRRLLEILSAGGPAADGLVISLVPLAGIAPATAKLGVDINTDTFYKVVAGNWAAMSFGSGVSPIELRATPFAGVAAADKYIGINTVTNTIAAYRSAADNWVSIAAAATSSVNPIVRNGVATTTQPSAAELLAAGDSDALNVTVYHDDIDTIVVWERTTTAAPWAAVASTDDTVAPSPYDLDVAYDAPQDRPPLLAELTAAGVNAETPDGSLFTKVLSDGRVEIYKLTANVWGLHRVELTPSAGAALVDSVTAQTYPAGTIIKVDPTHEIVFDQTVSNYYWTIPKNDWSEHTQDAGNGGTYSSPGVTTHAAGQDLPKTGNSIILWGYNPVTDNWEASFNTAVSSGGTTEPQRNSETIQMVTGTSIYALPEGVVSNSDLQRMTAILQGAGGLVRGESYTVAGATLTLLPPTSALVDNTMKLQVTY